MDFGGKQPTRLLKRVVYLQGIYQLLEEREWQDSLRAKFKARVAQCERLRWKLATRRLRQLGWTE